MAKFDEEFPSLESNFRSVVLFGRNSASYNLSFAPREYTKFPRHHTYKKPSKPA
jgi:hypothetical protein